MPLRDIQPWLEPLAAADAETDTDLEYEPEFLALFQAALGKPETQFAASEPPVWQTAIELAESLMQRTRDLRVAMLWCRAVVRLDGLGGLPAALGLLNGLLDNHWDTLHPRPDAEGDVFMRQAVLTGLDTSSGLVGDLRQALLLTDRRMAGLTMRDCEVAIDILPPRADEPALTPAYIRGLLSDTPELTAELGACIDEASQRLDLLDSLLLLRFGALDAPETRTLRSMLDALRMLLPADADAEAAVRAEPGSSRLPVADEHPVHGIGRIESRQDVVRALQMACSYLERHEPTNPAQWLLRRATQVIEMDFLQLVRLLAPDGSSEVERLFGQGPADPD